MSVPLDDVPTDILFSFEIELMEVVADTLSQARR